MTEVNQTTNQDVTSHPEYANLEEICQALVAESQSDEITEEVVVASVKAWLEATPFDDVNHIKLQQLAMMMGAENTTTLAVLAYRVGLSYYNILEKVGGLLTMFVAEHMSKFCEGIKGIKHLIDLIYDSEKKELTVGADIVYNTPPEDLFSRIVEGGPDAIGDMKALMAFLGNATEAIKSVPNK